MPFPLGTRKFEVPEKMLKNIPQDFTIAAAMATFPARTESLKKVVENILPQVDKLYVYLNNYTSIPSFLTDNKVVAILSSEAAGDVRDNGKFYFLANSNEDYYLTIDDDIVYAEDYVQKMVAKIQFYDHQRVVGVHGVVIPETPDRYFSEDRIVYTFWNKRGSDDPVNLLGTGTTGFYRKALVGLDFGFFETTGMADIWLAVYCKINKIGMTSIERNKNWMREMTPESETLFHEYRYSDDAQSELVKKHSPWVVI